MAYVAGAENTAVSMGKKHPPSDDEPKDEPSRTEQAWQVAGEYASDQREILKKLRKSSNR
jgi:hypothetical protein